MNIEYTNKITPAEVNMLRRAVGWAEVSEEQLKKGIPNSQFIISAKDGNKTVAMARAVGDGGYFLLLVEVMVLPEYQGHGIGRHMLTEFMSFVKSYVKPGQTVSVNLMSAKGKEEFYKKFGFIERPDEKYGPGMFQIVCG